MAQTGLVAGGRLTDWISLGVLTWWVPADAVEAATTAPATTPRSPSGSQTRSSQHDVKQAKWHWSMAT
jgi:hypothetical protein